VTVVHSRLFSSVNVIFSVQADAQLYGVHAIFSPRHTMYKLFKPGLGLGIGLGLGYILNRPVDGKITE